MEVLWLGFRERAQHLMTAPLSWLLKLQSINIVLIFHVFMWSFVRTFIFELWCERKKLLGDLDMAEAVASFIHLAFVFDLKYPRVSKVINLRALSIFI